MKNDYVIKTVSRGYLVVSTLSILAATIGMMVDSIIVGNFLGGQGLATLSIVNPVFQIFITLATILATGGTVKCAEYIGRDQPGKVNNTFTITMLVTGCIAVVLLCGGLFFRHPLAVALGAKGELVEPTMDFILGISFGTLPIMMSLVLMSFTRMDNSRNLSFYSVLAMTVVNITIDLLVVTVVPMGMFGIALATTLGYTASALVGASHFLRGHNTLHLRRIRNLFSELGRVSLTGLPDALSRFSSMARTMVLNHLLIVIGGVAAVTAFSVRTSAYYIAGALTMGVGHSIVPLAAIFYGEEDKIAMKDALVNTLQAGLAINVAGAALLYVFAGTFIRMFGITSAATAEICVVAVRLFALSMPLMLINVTLTEFFLAARNVLIANIICLCERLILVLGLSFLLSPHLGVNGVWLAFFLAEALMILVFPFIVRIKSGMWPTSFYRCMLLPAGFGGKPEDTLDISLGNSMREVVKLSDKVADFCRAHGIDKRRTYLLSLCIEEMAGNVAKHAFKPNEKRFMDIRVLVKNERLILRLRDNGRRFNPFEYLKTQDPRDVCSNIGIRLVHNMASHVDYRYSIGLNNLIITV